MPVEYFTDESGGHRYRIKGENGEKMATSEPYVSEANARRGLEDLHTVLTHDWLQIIKARHGENVSGSIGGKVSESEDQTDVSEANEIGEGSGQDTQSNGGEQFSKHDECPGDNPAALKEDNA